MGLYFYFHQQCNMRCVIHEILPGINVQDQRKRNKYAGGTAAAGFRSLISYYNTSHLQPNFLETPQNNSVADIVFTFTSAFLLGIGYNIYRSNMKKFKLLCPSVLVRYRSCQDIARKTNFPLNYYERQGGHTKKICRDCIASLIQRLSIRQLRSPPLKPLENFASYPTDPIESFLPRFNWMRR